MDRKEKGLRDGLKRSRSGDVTRVLSFYTYDVLLTLARQCDGGSHGVGEVDELKALDMCTKGGFGLNDSL